MSALFIGFNLNVFVMRLLLLLFCFGALSLNNLYGQLGKFLEQKAKQLLPIRDGFQYYPGIQTPYRYDPVVELPQSYQTYGVEFVPNSIETQILASKVNLQPYVQKIGNDVHFKVKCIVNPPEITQINTQRMVAVGGSRTQYDILEFRVNASAIVQLFSKEGILIHAFDYSDLSYSGAYGCQFNNKAQQQYDRLYTVPLYDDASLKRQLRYESNNILEDYRKDITSKVVAYLNEDFARYFTTRTIAVSVAFGFIERKKSYVDERFTKAQEHAFRALQQYGKNAIPDSIIIQWNKALLLWTSIIDDATVISGKPLVSDKEKIMARYNCAWAYCWLGEYDKSLALIEKAILESNQPSFQDVKNEIIDRKSRLKINK